MQKVKAQWSARNQRTVRDLPGQRTRDLRDARARGDRNEVEWGNHLRRVDLILFGRQISADALALNAGLAGCRGGRLLLIRALRAAAITRLSDLCFRRFARRAIQRKLAAAAMQGMEQQERGHQIAENCVHAFLKLTQFIITIIGSSVNGTCGESGKISPNSRASNNFALLVPCFGRGSRRHRYLCRWSPRSA